MLTIKNPSGDLGDRLLTGGAQKFLVELHKKYNTRRLNLLEDRIKRQISYDTGEKPDFLPETVSVRSDTWKVTPPPADLQDRRVEITGPTKANMVVNALNSGAKCFMADFEDATSPTWENIIQGQMNCYDAVRHQLKFTNPQGKEYSLNDELAVLLVRPRGWHLPEKHLLVDNEIMSGALVDFGLYAFHNLQERVNQNRGLFLYLPKIENYLEARLWNDVFDYTEEYIGVEKGSIRATVLIETIEAVFQMDEILYELRDHSIGLNAGRWDYIFSMIKKFAKDAEAILPDRGDVTMAVPFMTAYAELLVKTCHKRGTFAMGGMAAFVPSRKDSEINKKALEKVQEDKLREVNAGFDGTWVAHPDLVPVAMGVFDSVLGDSGNQINKLRDDVYVSQHDLLDVSSTPGKITEDGVRNNISVSLQYIMYWLMGIGAAAINNLMEDAATAEIARAQLWQWRKHGSELDSGKLFSADVYETMRDEELVKIKKIIETLQMNVDEEVINNAVCLLDDLVLKDEMIDFLTLPAYELID